LLEFYILFLYPMLLIPISIMLSFSWWLAYFNSSGFCQ
jgi:hypothetical protein